MRGKSMSFISSCLALLVLGFGLAAQDLKSPQTKNPVAIQDAAIGKTDKVPGKSLQDELGSHLQAIFKIQLEALEIGRAHV